MTKNIPLFAATVPTPILLKYLPISCQKIKLNYELFLLIFRTNVFPFYKCENGMLHHNALWFFLHQNLWLTEGPFFSIFRPSGNYLTLNGPYIWFQPKVEVILFPSTCNLTIFWWKNIMTKLLSCWPFLRFRKENLENSLIIAFQKSIE